MGTFSTMTTTGIELIMGYGPRLLLAIATLIVGWWVVGVVVRALSGAMAKHELDASLQSFARSVAGLVLKALLVISVAGMIGIEMTSFVALIAAAGLAVGMALSGTLQNFAGGVMILLFRPFKVGDVIEAQGFIGSVAEIQIFNTILKTPDNRTVIIPNAPLSSGSLVNYSTEATRRVDLTFGIGYQDDIDTAKGVIRELAGADKRVLTDPEPFIAVSELADSSVNLVVRLWTKSEDYWGVFFDMQEQVKKSFDQRNISIPYPQTDVHVHGDEASWPRAANA